MRIDTRASGGAVKCFAAGSFQEGKWHSLPETALLPSLAQALNTSIDYILVKYQSEQGTGYCFAKDKDYLIIDSQTKGYAPTKKAEIVDAIFGTQKKYYNVMQKIEHYKCFQWNEYQANHQTVPSNPSSDEKDFLTFVYLNKSGIHFVTCEEDRDRL